MLNHWNAHHKIIRVVPINLGYPSCNSRQYGILWYTTRSTNLEAMYAPWMTIKWTVHWSPKTKVDYDAHMECTVWLSIATDYSKPHAVKQPCMSWHSSVWVDISVYELTFQSTQMLVYIGSLWLHHLLAGLCMYGSCWTGSVTPLWRDLTLCLHLWWVVFCCVHI